MHTPATSTSAKTTGLPILFIVTFLNSLGTGVVTNGIFFLTKNAYGFKQSENFLLGIALGLTYIAGALGAGKAIAALRRALPGTSSRAILIGIMVLLAVLCVIPITALSLAPPGGTPSAWPIWLLITCYSPLTGVMWPMVESYISGGRRGQVLRSGMGLWNVVWSSAVVLSYWGMSPLVESHAALTILLLSTLHIAAAVLMLKFSSEPAPHLAEEHDPHPPVYGDLLVTLRMLLPLSYVMASAMSPYLPSAFTTLAVPVGWQTFLASAWLAPRVVAFYILQRWQGWHGRWGLPIAGGTMILCGFAVAVLAPLTLQLGLSKTAATALLLCGLFLFGTGKATIYAGALYYAMEVGAAEVEAGGMHEALIGVGYTVGPLCGLIPTLAVERGMSERLFQPIVLGTVACIALGVATKVMFKIRHHTR